MQDGPIEVINLANIMLPPGILDKVSLELINKYHFIPMGIKDNVLTVVFGEIPDDKTIGEIKTATKYEVKFVLSSKKEVRNYVESMVAGKGVPYKPSAMSFSDSIMQITRSQIVKYKNFVNTVASTQRKLNYIIIGAVVFVVVFSGVLLLTGFFNTASKSELDAITKQERERLKRLEQEITSKINLSQMIYEKNYQAVVLVYVYDEDDNRLGHGSGSIVRSDGVVLTNHHVIVGAHSIKVIREITPTSSADVEHNVEGIIFDDSENDLALLKVKGEKFPTVKIGDSDRTKEGEKIVIIGSPLHNIVYSEKGERLNTMNTVSEGLVSNKRSNKIQMTAQISPGSSGGPVFNSKGEVVGIATLVIRNTPETQAQNLNITMPINLIKDKISKKIFTPLGEYRYLSLANFRG